MLGIFGGTFDPIHYGHLSAAWQVTQQLHLNELRFMPCHHPPHRNEPFASAEQRINMLELAIKNIPEFTIDEREINSTEISYSVNSLKQIRQEINNESLCFILGLDAFNQIHTWHEPQKIIELAHIVVLGRPENHLNQTNMINDLMRFRVNDPNELTSKSAGLIYFVHNTLLDISSTQIRQLVKNDLDPKFLLPDEILKYIKSHSLYT